MCVEVGSRNEQLYPKELAPAERRSVRLQKGCKEQDVKWLTSASPSTLQTMTSV